MNTILPELDTGRCTLCGECALNCPERAISLPAGFYPQVDSERCSYCGDCADVCPVEAIALPVVIRYVNKSPRKG